MQKPIGAIDDAPLVVKTEDISAFLKRHLEVGPKGSYQYEPMVERIKTCRERGQIVHGVSYEVLKRIVKEDAPFTADQCADEILVSNGGIDLLGKDIKFYRNPLFDEEKYIKVFKARLKTQSVDPETGEVTDDWNEEEDMEHILSFPSPV